MKRLLLVLILWVTSICQAQFSIDAYKEYLESHKDMNYDQLVKEFPAGNFLKEAPTKLFEADYGDSIAMKYKLTNYEKELIAKHGFMVSERLTYNSFHNALMDVFHNDMPVYISSDAILFAVHHSFDKILKDIEEDKISNLLENLLDQLKTHTSNLSVKSIDSNYQYAVREYDFYISMARNLLAGQFYNDEDVVFKPFFTENEAKLITAKEKILAKQMDYSFKILSQTPRPVDFSQFTARGHYTDDLKEYFIAMMWLGRIEIYISSPEHQGIFEKQTELDLQRQCILAAMLAESIDNSEVKPLYSEIEVLLELLIGKQDNINVLEVAEVLKKLGNKDAVWVSEADNWKIFQQELLKLSSANQLYNSQILASDINDPEQAKTPTSLMLFGQRPIIDGFITGNVVFDRILYQNEKIDRALPNTLDILFSLGNDASIQLLESEINEFKYASNLAGLRYLISSYDTSFWRSSFYTNWLNSIRALNPPPKRDSLPKFMQTAAWWQKSMNTQLASWSQLRHDFILYAKQPYTSMYMCSYPFGYVEPVPELYKCLAILSKKFQDKLPSPYNRYFKNFSVVCEDLYSISVKELNGTNLSLSEIDFLQSTLVPPNGSCTDADGYLDGWFTEIFYKYAVEVRSEQVDVPCDYVVADVHTAPTYHQEEVGWVLHCGTGKVNMAVVVADNPGGGQRTYIGPVMSYYETVTDDYKRLTDQEWESYHQENAHRPALTNLYLADKNGREKLNQVSLLVSVEEQPGVLKSEILTSNYPNPFSESTQIRFNVPPDLSNSKVIVNIYSIEGQKVKCLVDENLPVNNYSIVWDGTDISGKKLQSGTYLFEIIIGEKKQTGKMVLIEK